MSVSVAATWSFKEVWLIFSSFWILYSHIQGLWLANNVQLHLNMFCERGFHLTFVLQFLKLLYYALNLKVVMPHLIVFLAYHLCRPRDKFNMFCYWKLTKITSLVTHWATEYYCYKRSCLVFCNFWSLCFVCKFVYWRRRRRYKVKEENYYSIS